MPTLGPFTLEAPLASGGMGTVWLARHLQTSLPVAIKFLRTDRAHARALAERIEQEAKLLAALSHPRILALVDWGRTPSAAADALGLTEGSPYLVLEYAPGGDLRRLAASLSWTDLRRVLLALLDALSHAHARSVVHLDIKPANVMLVAQGGASLEVKLGDFGIARRTDATGREVRLVAGTPGFIAPEVAAGDWRRVGPWSDLFALAALARFLLARDARVPEGLDAWLAQVGAPSPTERTLHAAHAAADLAALGPPRHLLDPRAPRAEEATWVWDEPIPHALPATISARPRCTRGVPEGWRPEVFLLPKRGLPDAGLATLALRSPALTGREPEQDALWSELRATDHGPRIAWIQGGAGQGCKALAEWLDLRATELGAAVGLAAELTEGDTVHDALRRAIRTWLRVHDLDADAAADVARGWSALHALAAPGAAAFDALARWCVGPSVPAPVDALHELLRCFSARSAVIVRLHDPDRALGGFRDLEPLLRDRSLRLLVVVTTGEPRENAPWQDLLAWAPSSTHPLGPLTLLQVEAALSSVAHLERGTARALAERSGGRPGVALADLRAAHAAGTLVASPDGLSMRSEAPPLQVSPADRARWLEDHGRHGEAGSYWLLAEDHDRAAAALLRGLRHATPLSEEGPAMPWIHQLDEVVARAPWPTSDPRRGEPALWRTTLLLGACRYTEAYAAGSRLLGEARSAGWDALVPRIQQLLGRICWYLGQSDEARTHLEAARAGAALAGDALTEGRAEVDLGRLLLARGDLDGAYALVRSGRDRVAGEVERAADLSHMLLADIALQRGRLDEAEAWCDLLARGRPASDVALVVLRATVHERRGDVAAAIRLYRSAVAALSPDHAVEHAVVMVNLARLWIPRGGHEEATGLLERALVGYRASGRRPLEAFCHGVLLEALATSRDRTAFARHLHEAERLLEMTGFRHPELEASLARTAARVRGLGWTEADRVDELLAGLPTPPPASSCT